MMTAIEEQRKSIHSEEEESSVTLPNATRASHDNTKTALVEKPKKYWTGSNFLQAVNACDKLFNCAYVKFQLEEELMEERMRQPKNNVERLFRQLDANAVEVEIYRQVLFEENGLEPFEDPSYHTPDCREGQTQRNVIDECSRTPEQQDRMNPTFF